MSDVGRVITTAEWVVEKTFMRLRKVDGGLFDWVDLPADASDEDIDAAIRAHGQLMASDKGAYEMNEQTK